MKAYEIAGKLMELGLNKEVKIKCGTANLEITYISKEDYFICDDDPDTNKIIMELHYETLE